MKYAMMGALLITLPAVIALVYSIIVGNHLLMYAALFSTGLNMLPFIAAGLMMGKQDGGHGPDLEH
jgi:predicted permease